MLLFSLILIGVGLWLLLEDSDVAWKRHEWRMRVLGVVSLQRTAEWDIYRRVGGAIFLIVGIILLVLVTVISSQSKARLPRSNIPIESTLVSFQSG